MEELEASENDKKSIAENIDHSTDEQSEKKKKKKEKKEEGDKYEKGVETMFRTTLSNHNNLSRTVDSKANILLSVNTILISLVFSNIFPKLDSPANHHLIIPSAILMAFSVSAAVFAILSTLPKVAKAKAYTQEEITKKKINLLFFGNFYKMPYDEYEVAMNDLIKDKTRVYNSMIKDLYNLGLVLQKKYHLLRIAYTIFMIGIVVAVISFFIALKVVI